MRKLPILIALFALSVSAGFGQKPSKGDTDVPAVTVFDTSVSNLRVSEDGLGAYQNGVNNVESIIQGIGDWVLNTRNSTVRTVRAGPW